MKKIPGPPSFRIAAAIVLLAFSNSLHSPPLNAIPNNVGGFMNPAGMRLEDFANRETMWQQDSVLKGDWEMWNDERIEDTTIELLRLQNSAIVFGLKVSEVTLQRRDNQPLRFDVEYTPVAGATVATTREQLIANINAWSGKTMKVDRQSATLTYEKISIQLKSTGTSLHLTLTPAAAGGA